jgi:hypothetical protein
MVNDQRSDQDTQPSIKAIQFRTSNSFGLNNQVPAIRPQRWFPALFHDSAGQIARLYQHQTRRT